MGGPKNGTAHRDSNLEFWKYCRILFVWADFLFWRGLYSSLLRRLRATNSRWCCNLHSNRTMGRQPLRFLGLMPRRERIWVDLDKAS